MGREKMRAELKGQFPKFDCNRGGFGDPYLSMGAEVSTLDGEFTAYELREIAKVMDNHRKKRKPIPVERLKVGDRFYWTKIDPTRQEIELRLRSPAKMNEVVSVERKIMTIHPSSIILESKCEGKSLRGQMDFGSLVYKE